MLKRKTIISNLVLEELEKKEHPISVNQLIENLKKKGLSPNKTTIYRILEKLVNKKIVTEISVRNSSSFYEFSKHHHHHFICNKCITVYCLSHCHINTHQINLNLLLPNKDFSIEAHDFNLYGVCAPCQNKLGEKK